MQLMTRTQRWLGAVALSGVSAFTLWSCDAPDAMIDSGGFDNSTETDAPLDEPSEALEMGDNVSSVDQSRGIAPHLVGPSTATEAMPAGQTTCEGDRCFSTRLTTSPRSGPGLFPVPPIPRATRLPRGSNTQIALPRHIMFADVDGDATSELLQFTSNKLFIKRSSFEQTGMAHLYTVRPITKILTGDFSNSGKDAVCPILDNGSLSCYGLSPDGQDLWWWFTQGNFLGSNEDAIVGDFDGDSRDDVLVYPRAGGAYRMYSVKGSAFFNPTPQFAPGNLSSVAVAGMRLRAGDFDGNGRTDIMAINNAGQIFDYASVWDGSKNTFWWAFTTNVIVGSSESVITGRIDNNPSDDIVIHNRSTGATRFLKMQYNGGYPPVVTGVSTGQIATWGNADLAMIRQSGNRDSAMIYGLDGNMFSLAGAAAPSTGLTYWWAYDQYLPRNDSGWAAFSSRPWLLVKCKYKNEVLEPHNNQWYRDVFTGDVPEYFREMSYGSYDLSANRVVDTWFQMTDTAQDARNITGNDRRWQRIQRCFNASGQSRTGYAGVVAVVNASVDSGNQGDVLLDTWNSAQNTSWFAHEMTHTLGLADSADDSTRKSADWAGEGYYYDSWDIMSANNIYTYKDWRGFWNGPEANSLNKRALGLVPSHRRQILVENPSKWITTTVQVAAINRPEANAPLFVEIQKASGTIFTIEYRIKDRLDTGLPQTTVMVHKQVPGGPSSVLTTAGSASGWNPERLPGNTYAISGLGWVTVDSFAANGYTAQVTVQY